jgi:hypothetical protein
MTTPFIVQNAVRTIRRDDLGLVLNQLSYTGEGVEVGTYRGDYSVQLLTKWTGQKLYSVDCWEEQNQSVYSDKVPSQEQQQNQQMTVAKLAAFGPRSQIIKGFSVEVAKTFADRSLDFAYLDANHSYEATLADIEAWGLKVRNGGLLCGDDYTADYPGVAKAVQEYARWMNLPVYTGCTDRVNWFIFYAYT